MATLLDLLDELPGLVADELRATLRALGPHATLAEMVAALTRLSPATREATLALLVTHAQEDLRAAAQALADSGEDPDGETTTT